MQIGQRFRRQANAGGSSGVAPSVTAAPTLSGATVDISTTYGGGTFAGTDPITLVYAWLLDDVVIGGATASTYTPVGGDATKTLKVRLTASNAYGSAQSTSSGVTIAAGGSFVQLSASQSTGKTAAPISKTWGLHQAHRDMGGSSVGASVKLGDTQIRIPARAIRVKLLSVNGSASVPLGINRAAIALAASSLQASSGPGFTWSSDITFSSVTPSEGAPVNTPIATDAGYDPVRLVSGYALSDWAYINDTNIQPAGWRNLRIRGHFTANSTLGGADATNYNAMSANPGFVVGSALTSGAASTLQTASMSPAAATGLVWPGAIVVDYGRPVVDLVTVGDSLYAAGFDAQSAAVGWTQRLMFDTVGANQILTTMNLASNGQNFMTMMANARALLAVYKPTFMAIPVAGTNSVSGTPWITQGHFDTMWTELQSLVADCLAVDVTPVVLTMAPTVTSQGIIETQNARALTLDARCIIVDACATLKSPSAWRLQKISSGDANDYDAGDGQHWTTAAQAAVAAEAKTAINARLIQEAQYTYLGYGANPKDRVDSNGRIVLQKHGSAVVWYCDPINGSDTYDGTAGTWQGGLVGPKRWVYRAWQNIVNDRGDWVAISSAVGADASAIGSMQGASPKRGLSRQYPVVVTSYNPTGWTAGTPNLRQGRWRWNLTSTDEWSIVSTEAAPIKYVVFENCESLPATRTPYGFRITGWGDGILFENFVTDYKQITGSCPQVLDSEKYAALSNFAIRKSGLDHGVGVSAFHDDGNTIEPHIQECVIYRGGYAGTTRNSGDQQGYAPEPGTHGIYTYGFNARVQRCLIGMSSSFGLSMRRGGLVQSNVLTRNAGHIVIAGASTDTNEDYPGTSIVVRNNLLSGMEYINGTNTAAGANGFAIGINLADETSHFKIGSNLVLDNANQIPAGSVTNLSCNGGPSNAAVLLRRKAVTVNTTAGIGGRLYKLNSTDSYAIYFIRGNVLEAYRETSGWSLSPGDQLSLSENSATVACTVSSVAELPTLIFNGALPHFDANIIRGSGTTGFSTSVTGGATVTPVNLTNNVTDVVADQTGSNVSYASVVGGYSAPTRNVDAYATASGFANTAAMMAYAVRHPEYPWATDILNWTRQGFNLAAI